MMVSTRRLDPAFHVGIGKPRDADDALSFRHHRER
jgi:hypothetical protein